MDNIWYILIVLVLSFLVGPASLLLMFWFDSKITPNPDLRMQANFECVYCLFFAPITLVAFLASARSDPLQLFDSRMATGMLCFHSVACLTLSFPAMLGVRSANRLLFYLAWPRLLFPCVGWIFSFFTIRYYLRGTRKINEGTYDDTSPQPPRDRW